MQFKPAIVAAFVAVGLAAAAPPPTSNGKSPTSDVISFALSAGKGAAISLSNGDTVVYYQAIDGSIRELTGNGPPSTPQTYTEIVRLESSQVRRNTAIATVRDNGLGGLYGLYYIGKDNKLKEMRFGEGGSFSGSLNSQNITAKINSNYIYAIAPPNSFQVRVGYECGNGRLCEVQQVSGGQWTIREF